MRLQKPNRNDFMGYTTRKNGEFVYLNNSGNILYRFKDEEDCRLKANAIGHTLIELYQIQRRDYDWQEKGTEKTYKEFNWVHRCLYKGFEAKGIHKDIDPYDNWFGCSLRHPDIWLQKGNKNIILSLQGGEVEITHEIVDRYKELFKTCSVRYICLKEDNNTVYQTYTGEVPDMELVEEFIK